MLAYSIRKLLFSVIVLFFSSVAIFILISLAGDPLAQLRANPSISGDDLDRFARIYGLDEPLYEQYLVWMSGVLQGDLGQSFQQNAPVNEIIGRRIVPTVTLVGSALIITLAVAIPLGIFQAIRKYTAWDNALTFVAFLLFSIPVFFLGLMLQLAFAVYLTDLVGGRVFYTAGMSEPGGGFVDLLQHLTLPSLAIAGLSIAAYSRFQRASMLDVLGSDYLRTARAKGLSERSVTYKHALRNALIPIVNLIALSMPGLIGGSVVIEIIFSWPGLGSQFLDSLQKGDYDVARGFLVVLAGLIVVFNLIADLAIAVVDPRIRYD